MRRERLGNKASSRPAELVEQTHEALVVRGLIVEVRGRDLAVRLGERVRWHRERGDVLLAQLARLADVERAAADDLVDALGRYESVRNLLERRFQEHQGRAAFLAFIRDHLSPDVVYHLDANDLRMIGDRSHAALG